MQFGKSFTKLELATIDIYGTKRAFFALNCIRRQQIGIDTKEVTHSCPLELQITGNSIMRRHVNDILLWLTENPLQHIVEMHSDVGGNASTLVYITLPRRVVPVAA